MTARQQSSVVRTFTLNRKSKSSRSSSCTVLPPRQAFHMAQNQGGPAGLMAGAQPFAGFAMEVFMEQDQVAPVRVFGPARVVPEAGAASILVGQKKAGQPT